MSIARLRPPRVALLVVGAATALALAGCGAGQIAQTSKQSAAVSGANVTAGTIAVRNAEIAYPDVPSRSIAVYGTGSDAPLSALVVNKSDLPDRLVSASSPYASAVRLDGDSVLGPHESLVLGGPDLVAPPNAKAVRATLTGLLGDLNAGLTYQVVLQFERAGTVTVDLPLGSADNLAPGENAQAPAGSTPPAGESGGGH